MPPHEAASEDVGALLNAGVAPASQKGGKRLTWAEIARHNTPKDCWIVIRGKVYAVHDFVKAHPGGHILLTYGGEDATGTEKEKKNKQKIAIHFVVHL